MKASRRHRARHTTLSLLQSVVEDVGTQADIVDVIPQLPTPRETPQPEDTNNTPAISDTLFDFLDIPLDSNDSHVHRTHTGTLGNPLMSCVDHKGVFDIEILFCACSNKKSKDEQLLRAGLFPATFKQIETLFTFTVLEDFLTDNLECKTTAQQYYSKLQSMTSNMFPDHVPVSYIATPLLDSILT